MKIVKNILFVAVLLLAFKLSVFSSTPKIISSENTSFLVDAYYNGSMVTEHNVFMLAPVVKSFGVIEGKHIWKLYKAFDGTLYAATSGENAEIYKQKDGETNFTLFAKDDKQNAFTAIAVDTEGNIYAASSPNAMLYKFDKNGEKIFEVILDDIYVWDIKFDKNGDILIATGGNGARILKSTKDGKITELLKTEETHAMSLCYDETNNVLYVGTAGRGLVLKVNPVDGKYSILYDTAESEVHTVTMDKKGNIYFGTSLRENASLILPSIIDGNRAEGQQNGRQFRNSLYRANKNGSVQRLFYLSQNTVFAITADRENNIYFITGDNTDIYKINSEGEVLGYIGGLKNKNISAFTADSNGVIYLAAARSGEIYKMENFYPEQGEFISDVIDVKLTSHFGVFNYEANLPEGTSVSILTRTGNSARVDTTWSDFEATDVNRKIKSPKARFIQFKIVMNTKDKNISPKVNSIHFSYVTQNIAPDILNGNLITYYKQQNTSNEAMKRPQLGENDAMIWWNGSDLNGDTLIYSLEYRLKGETKYRLMSTNITKTYFIFDARKLASSIYDFKITASDRLDNTPMDALTKSLEMLNVKYDNTPPVVENINIEKDSSGMFSVSFDVSDNLSIIRSVRYSTINNDWTYAESKDKIIDSMKESFIVTLPADSSSISIEVSDIEGNTAYYSFVLR